MIKSIRCLFEYNLKFDRFKSEYNENLLLEQKLYFINQAQFKIFRNKIDNFTEKTSKYRTELRFFEEKEHRLELVEKLDTYSIYKLPENYYKILRQRCVQSKEGCGEKDIKLFFFETDDLNNALSNPYWKPSFEWGQGICDEGNKGLYIWTDSSADIEEVIIDYYRKPAEIHAPSLHHNKEYVSWDGELITKDSGLELEENLNEIINLAILDTRASFGDVKDYELQLSKIFNTEKIN